MTPDNDPGSAAASARVAALESVASEPLQLDGGGRIFVGTASWTDPTMTAAGVFYPNGADSAEERLAVLRGDVPARRGRRHLLRAAGRADRAALGRPDAAGLHVRHQGPRADDRPGDGDPAPAEGDPRGPAGGPAGQGADLREGPAGGAPGRGLADVPGRAGAARGARPAGLDPPPVPALVLPVEREPGADRGGGRAARRLEGRGRVPQRLVAQREERRADDCASSPSGTSRS